MWLILRSFKKCRSHALLKLRGLSSPFTAYDLFVLDSMRLDLREMFKVSAKGGVCGGMFFTRVASLINFDNIRSL